MAKKQAAPKTPFDKLKLADPEFVENNMSRSPEEMESMIVDFTKEKIEILKAQAEDPDISSLKEQLKTARETYKEPVRLRDLRIAFLLERLAERGK